MADVHLPQLAYAPDQDNGKFQNINYSIHCIQGRITLHARKSLAAAVTVSALAWNADGTLSDMRLWSGGDARNGEAREVSALERHARGPTGPVPEERFSRLVWPAYDS